MLISGLWSARVMRAALKAGAIDCLEKSDEGLAALVSLLERLETVRGQELDVGQTVRRQELDVGPFPIPPVEQVTDEYIIGLTAVYGGNVTRAAEEAGRDRTSWHRGLKRARKRTRERKAQRRDGE